MNFSFFMTAIALGVGLAMDAFSVAITDGITIKKVKLANALKIALFFITFHLRDIR